MIRRIVSWEHVLNAARITQNKEYLNKEPSENFKETMIKSRHKPLEIVRYEIITKMPRFVYFHFRAHRDPLAFVGSRRDDLQDKPNDPNEIVDAYLNVSAEDLLHMAEQRLCGKSHQKTIIEMAKIKRELGLIEPTLANHMHPKCVLEGFCREKESCLFINSIKYKKDRKWFVDQFEKKEEQHGEVCLICGKRDAMPNKQYCKECHIRWNKGE